MTTSSSSSEIGPVSVVHEGIEYPGVVVRAQRWDPVWSEQLRGDDYFRVVFLEQPAPPDWVSLHDDRIAMCVPDQHELSDESSLREPQTRYVTGPHAQVSDLSGLAQVMNRANSRFITKLLEQPSS